MCLGHPQSSTGKQSVYFVRADLYILLCSVEVGSKFSRTAGGLHVSGRRAECVGLSN